MTPTKEEIAEALKWMEAGDIWRGDAAPASYGRILAAALRAAETTINEEVEIRIAMMREQERLHGVIKSGMNREAELRKDIESRILACAFLADEANKSDELAEKAEAENARLSDELNQKQWSLNTAVSENAVLKLSLDDMTEQRDIIGKYSDGQRNELCRFFHAQAETESKIAALKARLALAEAVVAAAEVEEEVGNLGPCGRLRSAMSKCHAAYDAQEKNR